MLVQMPGMILALLLLLTGNHRTESAEPERYILRLRPNSSDAVIENIRERLPGARVKMIYPDLDLASIVFPRALADEIQVPQLLGQYQRSGKILGWHRSARIQLRKDPNDPLWDEQWGMRITAFQNAWDLSTGGVTAHGDTIVAAILDDGFEIDHDDLDGVFWQNRLEIPNDGIDNDGNGYIDDRVGYNVESENDDHPRLNHGTAVAGIIGATGNNARGISGTNWDIRLLPLSGVRNVDQVIEAYSYIKSMRRLYNETGGESGACVVVTNASLGIDNAWADDYPLWCAVYDDLGASGVLSVAATTNQNVDVGIEGDMPSTCASDYLIVVTNTDMEDNKFRQAGYSDIHVDVGAPGTPTLTTSFGNAYREFGSTSASSPFVAGAIGLMYSIDCVALSDSMLIAPERTAGAVRNALFSHIDLLPSLDSLTLLGGRLNASAALVNVCSEFTPVSEVLRIVEVYPNPASDRLTIQYESSGPSEHEVILFDVRGRIVSERQHLPLGALNSVSFEFGDVPAGIYVVSVRKGKDIDSRQIVVLR